ncbi:hypothetical protein Hanom_Chr03g00210441 [Helianthus anomalus]
MKVLLYYLGVVIFPDPASDLMTSQIKSFKLNFPNTQFFRCRILCWLMLNQPLHTTQQTNKLDD